MGNFFCAIKEQNDKSPCLYEQGKTTKGNTTCPQCDYFIHSLNPATKNFEEDSWAQMLEGKNVSEYMRRRFAKDREALEENWDPLMAIKLFIAAHKYKIIPPPEVFDWLAKGLKYFYLIHYGKEPLEEILGFKTPWGNVFKTKREKQRDSILLWDVVMLQAYFEIDLKKACRMAAARLQSSKAFDRWSFCIKRIGPSKLEQKYRTHRKLYKGVQDDIRKKLPWTKEKKKTYLKKFPVECLPLSLKRLTLE